MGIRFRCPQGHKLHVKSFLAGKKGVCPDCGARVRIPVESTIRKDGTTIVQGTAASLTDDEDAHEIPPETPAMKSGEDLRDAAPVPQGAAPPQAIATTVPRGASPAPIASTSPATAVPVGMSAAVPTNAVAAHPQGTPATPVRAVTAVAGGMPGAQGAPFASAVRAVTPAAGQAMPSGVPMATIPTAMVPTAVVPTAAIARPVVAAGGPLPPGLVDPISEAPQAVWYVRPTSGGQYGPARGDVFRQWLGQGRVAADSLVWREGWGDWRTAADAFPELKGLPSAVGAVTGNIGDANAARSTATYLARRQSSTMVGIGLMVMLGIICLALVVVLILILPKAN